MLIQRHCEFRPADLDCNAFDNCATSNELIVEDCHRINGFLALNASHAGLNGHRRSVFQIYFLANDSESRNLDAMTIYFSVQ